jgi:hypothetical protein
MGLETEWFIDMTWRFTRYDNFLLGIIGSMAQDWIKRSIGAL